MAWTKGETEATERGGALRVEEATAGDPPRDSALEQRLTPIQEFFAGRSVLITGATGFMGKVLLEKLLHSCPGIRAVYVILRPKKDCSIAQRVEELVKDCVFCRLVKDDWQRMFPIPGDITRPNLGLAKEHLTRICKEVSIVFHLAATVRFDEQLRVAAAINVRGTMELLRLCRDMPKLQAVVHTSTAYSQIIHPRIEERHYDAPISSESLMALCDQLQPGKQNEDGLATRLLGDYPNTYLFTKAVAEAMIKDDFPDIPVAIIRPAMVSSPNEEPYPGWVDNFNGPVGIGAGTVMGVLHVMYGDEKAIANMVPCDMTINLIISAAWDLATNRHIRREKWPIYNHVSSRDAPLTFHEFQEVSLLHNQRAPGMKAMWYASFGMVHNRLLYLFWVTLLHLVPGIIVDTLLILKGKKPMMVRLYRKIHHAINLYTPFTTRYWDFDNAQTKALWSRLSSQDRQLFPFDMRDFNWYRYLYYFLIGGRTHLVHDDMSTVPAAIIRYRRLYWLHEGLKTLVFVILTLVSWRAINAMVSIVF